MAKGPVLIDLEDAPVLEVGPEDVQPVPDLDAPAPTGQAMQTVATLAARRPSRLMKLFWGLLLSLLGFAISLAAWDFALGLVARVPLLGYAVTVLLVAFISVLLVMALRELAAFSRLKRMDVIHRAGEAARASGDLAEAKGVVDQITRLYKRAKIRAGGAMLWPRKAWISWMVTVCWILQSGMFLARSTPPQLAKLKLRRDRWRW